MREWRWKKLVGLETEAYRLLDAQGRNRCTVWKSGMWHTWNEHGVGGENDTAINVNVAMEEATMAVIRQGWARLVSTSRVRS